MSLNYLTHFDGLATPQRVCYDADKTKQIYVADLGNDRIAILDQDLNFQGDLSPGVMLDVQGVATRAGDVLGVCNPQQLIVHDHNGTWLGRHTITGSVQPQACAYVSLTEETVITDFANHQLVALDSNYDLVGNLGTGVTGISAPGPDDFNQPKDVIYAEDQQVGPALFVADTFNERVVRIAVSGGDAVGKMTVDASNSWTYDQGATPAGGSPFRPTGLAYRGGDETLFCIDGYARVWAIDIRRSRVRIIYSNPGTGPGQLRNAAGIALVGDDRLVITDYTNNRATLYEI